MITIRPQAGLGNRLRSLDSAVQLAEKMNRPLRIHWVRNYDCNCRFSDLFVIDEKYEVKENRGFIRDTGKIESAVNILKKSWNSVFHSKNRAIFFNKDVLDLKKIPEYWKELQSYKEIYLQTETLFLNGGERFWYLQPNEFIQENVKRTIGNSCENFVGMHIRRSDNKRSRQFSPTELFIQRIEDEFRKNKDTCVFLATDSKTEEDKLKSLFGDRIITHPKRSYDRNSKEAIQDALVDMLCLSKTTRIYGSYYSSFSEIASDLGGIPLEVVKTNLTEE